MASWVIIPVHVSNYFLDDSLWQNSQGTSLSRLESAEQKNNLLRSSSVFEFMYFASDGDDES